jgi:undecaprenyl-diphosphatase
LKKDTGLIRFSVIEIILAVGLFLLSVILFSVIADEIIIEKEGYFDIRVFHFIASYVSPSTTRTALIITYFGSAYFLIPAYLVIIFRFMLTKERKQAILVAIVALVSLLSGGLLKDIFHRSRPLSPLIPGVSGYSFPSGHSLAGFTFSGILIYLLFRSRVKPYLKWLLSIFFFFFACLIGLSRIYLRVHFASDVLASLLVTLVWLSLTFIIVNSMEKRRTSLV